MVKVFDYRDYRKFINDLILSRPKKGYGEYRRIAESLSVSTTIVSQVLKGDKVISMEMANDLCDYFNLDEDSSEFLLLLVEKERAGTQRLKNRLEKLIDDKQLKFRKLDTRLKKVTEIDETTKAVFFSSWMYSGIQNLCGIDRIRNVHDLAEHLSLPVQQVQKVVDFLIRHKLLVQSAKGLEVGQMQTHIKSTHVLTPRHHQNWRIHGFQKMSVQDDQAFFFTMPASLSNSLAEKVRKDLMNFVENLHGQIGPSPSETTRCLNIDWFDY